MKLITVALSALAFGGFAAAQKGVHTLVNTSVSDKGTSIDLVDKACTKVIPPSPSSHDVRYPDNTFLTVTTTIQRWCNGYPCGENGELRTTPAAAERRGKAIEPDRTTYSPIHEPGDVSTTEEVTVSAPPASCTLPADNGDPRTTSEVIFSVLPVPSTSDEGWFSVLPVPTSVTGVPSEFWYLLAPTSLTYGPVPCSDLRGSCPPVAPTSLTDGAVPSSDWRGEASSPFAHATTAVYTVDCIHHLCPSGQPTVITMLPFLPKITVKPSGLEPTGNPQTYSQTGDEKREAGVLTERSGLDQLPITTQTTMKSVAKRDSAEMSFPDAPPKPTQTLVSFSFSIPSLSPLPQTVATTDPCYRHYCPPGQSTRSHSTHGHSTRDQ